MHGRWMLSISEWIGETSFHCVEITLSDSGSFVGEENGVEHQMLALGDVVYWQSHTEVDEVPLVQ